MPVGAEVGALVSPSTPAKLASRGSRRVRGRASRGAMSCAGCVVLACFVEPVGILNFIPLRRLPESRSVLADGKVPAGQHVTTHRPADRREPPRPLGPIPALY